MERDLRRLGHLVEREVGVIVYHRGEPLARQRLDMVVDNRVVVEIKATEQLHPSASAQLFSIYARRTTSWSAASLRTQGRVQATDLREPSQSPTGPSVNALCSLVPVRA